METDRGELHKIPPRREHEKEELVSVETESVKSRLHAVPDVNILYILISGSGGEL